jgi:SAM-dependent methyltransferase
MNTCLICNTPLTDKGLVERPYPKDKLDRGPDTIIDCPNCGVGTATPFPTEEQLNELVDWSEFWHTGERQNIRYATYPLAAGLGRTRMEFVLSHYGEVHGDISILDIGAGQGFFGIEAAKKLGSNLTHYSVVEFDLALKQDIANAWDFYKLPGQFTHYEHLKDVEDQYDLVILSHVLEHVRDPRDFISRSLSHLKPGGLILVDVPHTDYRFKPNVFLHLYFFTPDTLEYLVNSIKGIQVIQSGSWGRYQNKTVLGKTYDFLFRQFFRIAHRLHGKIPVQISIKFYTYLYGGNTPNPEGTWVRLIARKKP